MGFPQPGPNRSFRKMARFWVRLQCTIPNREHPQSSDFELIDAAGHIALIAIELERSHLALKTAIVEIKDSENRLKTIIDTMPALAWSARPDGSAEFFNRRRLDYAGLSAEEAADWGWTSVVHADDLNRLADYWRSILGSANRERSKRVSAVLTECIV